MPIRRTSNKSSYDSGFYNPEVYSDVGSRKIFEFDSNALTYINAVEAADGQALEFNVKVAYNNFVLGCKSDGIWNAIKASCIMAGARTLSGALTPLVGAAPTNNNFVAGDYNRITGLVGNGSTKYLDTNRNNNADPQNSNHNAVWASVAEVSPNFGIYIGSEGITDGTNNLGRASIPATDFIFRNRTNIPYFAVNQGGATGFVGMNRSTSSAYAVRLLGVNTVVNQASAAATSFPLHIFQRSAGVAVTTARLSFYSIGESLDLALLDARVSGLMVAISGAVA